MAIRRIGQIFVDLGFISDDQLEILLDEQQQRPHEMLGRIAESMGFINDEQLAQALAEQMGMQAISLGAHARWFEPFLIFVRGIDKNHSGVPIKTGIDPHVVTTKGMPDQYIWRERLRFL